MINLVGLLEFLDQFVKRVHVMMLERSIEMRVTTHAKIDVIFLFNSIHSRVTALLSQRASLGA
jgi:hypothetical protein